MTSQARSVVPRVDTSASQRRSDCGINDHAAPAALVSVFAPTLAFHRKHIEGEVF